MICVRQIFEPPHVVGREASSWDWALGGANVVGVAPESESSGKVILT